MCNLSAARIDGLDDAKDRRSVYRRVVHFLFEAGLIIKAGLCSAESLAGLGLLLVPVKRVNDLVFWLTHFEITAHPQDPLATWSRDAVAQFTLGTEQFYGWYLLVHGGLKLVMVIMLWSKVIWAYPASMAVLAGFVTYQLYEFVYDSSPFLLLLAAFDLFMIWLIWQEYRMLRPPSVAADPIAPGP